MRKIISFVKHFCMIFRGSWRICNNPEFRDLLKYRYVLCVAEKSTLNPKVACVRHFALFEDFPSLEDCVVLRNEVLEDAEKGEESEFGIVWERDHIAFDDLIVVGLGPTDSTTFSRGIFCDFLSDELKIKEEDKISIV